MKSLKLKYMQNLSIVVLQSALQEQKSPKMEISEMIDLLLSKFQPLKSSQYVTLNEAALLLKVGVQTVRNRTKRGELKPCRWAHRVFYKRQEIMESLNSNQL